MIGDSLSVAQLSRRFLENRLLEGGPDRRRFYAKHTRRFLEKFARVQVRDVRAYHVLEIKEAMLRGGFKPKTINHDITSVATMLQWAADTELSPVLGVGRLFRLRLPLGPIPRKGLQTIRQVWDFVHIEKRDGACRLDKDQYTVDCLTLSYLAALRPMELVRILTGQAEAYEPGVITLPNKMGWRNRIPRFVILSDEAQAHYNRLVRIRPRWTKLYTYSRGVVRRRGSGPHRLRHSAASHLRKVHGVDRATVDLILGHYPPETSWVYTDEDWQKMRQTVAQLSLRLPHLSLPESGDTARTSASPLEDPLGNSDLV